MSKCKFPTSLPRKMYWSDDAGGHASCPTCRAPIESEHHTYVTVTRRDGEMDFHIVGNTAGYFCRRCPVVVLDSDEFERMIAFAARIADEVDYVVMGIVDLDAVPEDKRSLPFDDETNPVPLVQFTNVGGRESSSKSGTKQHSRKRRKRNVKGP